MNMIINLSLKGFAHLIIDEAEYFGGQLSDGSRLQLYAGLHLDEVDVLQLDRVPSKDTWRFLSWEALPTGAASWFVALGESSSPQLSRISPRMGFIAPDSARCPGCISLQAGTIIKKV